jgi:hypothetical protein
VGYFCGYPVKLIALPGGIRYPSQTRKMINPARHTHGEIEITTENSCTLCFINYNEGSSNEGILPGD